MAAPDTVPTYTTKDFHPSLPVAPRQAREVSKDEKKNRKDFQKFMTQIEGFKTDVNKSQRLANASFKHAMSAFDKIANNVIASLDPLVDSEEDYDANYELWMQEEIKWRAILEHERDALEELNQIENYNSPPVKAVRHMIDNLQKEIETRLKEFETSLKEDSNVQQINFICEGLDQVKAQIDEQLIKFYNDAVRLHQEYQDKYYLDYSTFKESSLARINKMLMDATNYLSSKPPVASPTKELEDRVEQLSRQLSQATIQRSLNSTLTLNPDLQQNHSTAASGHSIQSNISDGGIGRTYEKRKPPKFTGDILRYPRWYDEMRYTIAPHTKEREMITLLDENTPSTINLANNDTLEQCWEDLNNRYANPTVIVAKVSKTFLDFKPKSNWSSQLALLQLESIVTDTYKSLKCVDRLKQLTEVDHMLAHAMECLPETYRDQVYHLQLDNAEKGESALPPFEVFYSYLKDKKKALEKFGGHMLDDVLRGASGGAKKVHSTEVNHVKAQASNNDKQKTGMEKMWEKFGPCPECKRPGHFYKTREGRKLASSKLQECPVWRPKPAAEKIKTLAQAGGCVICTSWTH